ncbi:hypothetical protein HI13_contig00002-0196, partial [Edwardsiella piscicida]
MQKKPTEKKKMARYPPEFSSGWAILVYMKNIKASMAELIPIIALLFNGISNEINGSVKYKRHSHANDHVTPALIILLLDMPNKGFLSLNIPPSNHGIIFSKCSLLWVPYMYDIKIHPNDDSMVTGTI